LEHNHVLAYLFIIIFWGLHVDRKSNKISKNGHKFFYLKKKLGENLCKFVGIKCRPTPFRQGRRVFRCVMLASDCMTRTCYCRRFRRIMLPPTSPFRDVRDIVFPISEPRMCKRASDDPEKKTLRFSISAVYWYRRWTYSRRIRNIMLKITFIYVKDFSYRGGSWAGTPWARPGEVGC
jgi:hypothetical protein